MENQNVQEPKTILNDVELKSIMDSGELAKQLKNYLINFYNPVVAARAIKMLDLEFTNFLN